MQMTSEFQRVSVLYKKLKKDSKTNTKRIKNKWNKNRRNKNFQKN